MNNTETNMHIYKIYLKIIEEVKNVERRKKELDKEINNIIIKAQYEKANERKIKDKAYTNYKTLRNKIDSYLNQIPTDLNRPRLLLEGEERDFDETILTRIAMEAFSSTEKKQEKYSELYLYATGMLKSIEKKYEKEQFYESEVDYESMYLNKKKMNEMEIDKLYISIIRGNLIREFVDKCEKIRNYNTYIFDCAYDFYVPDKYAEELKRILLGKYSIKRKKIWIPYFIKKKKCNMFFLNHDSNQEKADLAVVNFIMGFLYSGVASECYVQYIDALRMTSEGLGPFELMARKFNSPIYEVPEKREKILSAIKEVWEYAYSDIEPKLLGAGCSTVYEYNVKYMQNRIKRKMIIINGFPYAYSTDEITMINQLVNSSKRYGLSFVFIADINLLGRNSQELDSLLISLKNSGMRKILCDSKDFHLRKTVSSLSDQYVDYYCPNPKLPNIIEGERFNYYLYYKKRDVAKIVMQKIIWRFIESNNEYGCKIQYIDFTNFLARDLDIFEPLLHMKESIFEKVPVDNNNINEILKRLSYFYREVIDKKLITNGFNSIYEYNKNSKDNIKSLLLIFDNYIQIDMNNNVYFNQLISKGKNWGISFLIMKEEKYDNNEKDDLYQVLNRNDLYSSACDLPNFVEEELPIIDKKFIDKYCSPEVIDLNRLSFYTWNDINSFDRYERYILKNGKKERKPLMIPAFLDDNDDLHNFEFEYYNKFGQLADGSGFAGYLEGSSGSGKTTLIHSLIGGVIKAFHPDDVELWIADFKGTEFGIYNDHMPPHIKYLILEKSERIICDFLDVISEELVKRIGILSHYKCSDIFQLDAEIHLPRVLIIIDEFEEMIKILDVTNDLLPYKEKLKTLLAKGRSYGFRILFSSQNYDKASRFLGESSNNIPMRIAMMNKDMKEMMSILSPEFSIGSIQYDELKENVKKLPPYESIIGLVDESTGKISSYKRVKNLWFPDWGEKNNKIISYIETLNKYFIPVKENKYDINNIRFYRDKSVQVINGNRLFSYKDKKDEIERVKLLNPECVNEDNVSLFIGVAQSLVNIKPIIIEKSKYNNLLLVGSNIHLPCLASIMLSIMQQFFITGYEIAMLSNMKSKLYKEYAEKEWIQMGAKQNYLDMYVFINKIYENVQKHIPGKVLLVLCDTLSMGEEIIDAIEEYNEENVIDEKKKKNIEAKSDEEKMAEELIQFMPTEIAEMMKTAINSNFELDDNIINSFNKYDFDSNKTGKDIWEKISWILDKGPRLGYHILNVCCDPKDAEKKSATMNTFDQNLYSHILSFKIDSNIANNKLGDSLRLAATIEKDEPVPDKSVCMYIGSDERYTFRPFLHKGITWDNEWIVDEQGYAKFII